MTKKQIIFNKKPVSIENSKDIDKWVHGKDYLSALTVNNTPVIEEATKRFTIVIPQDLYTKLRIKCAKNDTTLKDFIIDILSKNID